MKQSNDWVAFVLNRTKLQGSQYIFNTADGVLLAKIIENASKMDYKQFLEENLNNLLAINTLEVEQDPSGNYNGGDGYSVSLLDWTKLANLFLQEGIVEGRKVIDPNFVTESTTSQFQISNSQEIGYLWNLYGDDFQNVFGVDHNEVYSMIGGLGQSVFVVPSENLVIAILADNFFGFNNLSLNLFADISFTIQTTQ